MTKNYQISPRTGWLTVFLLGMAIAVPQPEVDGQVVASYFNGDGDFGYDIQSMTDLDQKRLGLQNDGCMYCVPTATMNLFGYAANFGYPDLPPGPGFWQGEANHDFITNHLGFLGLVMKTNPTGGTSFGNMVDGADEWISNYSQQLFTSANARKSGYWPTIDDITEIAVNGGLVQFCYGRYDWQLIADRPFLTGRTGGHCVTLKLAFATNGQIDGPRLIHMRNPSSSDGDLESNSDYSSSNLNTAENLTIGISYIDDGVTTEYNVTSLLNPTPGQYRIIDSYLALYPNGGASYSGIQVNPAFIGGGLGFVQNQQPQPFNAPPGSSILSVIPHPLAHSTLVMTAAPESPVQLFEARHSGRFNHLIDLDEDVQSLAAGPNNTMLIVKLKSLLVSSYQNSRSGKGSVSEPELILSIPAAIPRITSVAVDCESDEIYVCAGSFIYNKQPNVAASVVFRSSGVGNATLPFVDTAVYNGQLFAVLSDGRVVKTNLNRTDADDGFMHFENVNLPLLTAPIAIGFDSQGRMYVSDQQQGLLEFVSDGNGGWVFPKTFNFVGMFPPGHRFVPFKNNTNIRPGDLIESEWKNILPQDLIPLGPDLPDN